MPMHANDVRCHLCGRPMAGVLCAFCDTVASVERGRRSRARDAVAAQLRFHGRLAAVLVALLLVGAVLRSWTSPTQDADVAASRERPTAEQSTPAAGAERSETAAVLTVNASGSEWDAPQGRPGHAFVIRQEGTWSDMLTDYYLLAERYMAGERTVTVSDGTSFLTGRVMATDSDKHVARVRVDSQLPALPIAPLQPEAGERVIILSRSGESISGVVVPVKGLRAAGHLAFSAVVPSSLDGAPVINADGEVVGIAEPSDEAMTADGIGFAVPIAAACLAVTC